MRLIHALVLTLVLTLVAPLPAAATPALVIAHRGASGDRPEHTLAAYERAIDQGADYIEIDLVPTKDLVLVARHETELGGTTDVAGRSEFASRQRSKTVDGKLVSGWFAEDFTLAELATLRAKERLPGVRPANAQFDGLWQVPTFADIVKLVRAKEKETGREIGLYVELKHPTWLLEASAIDSVDLLVTALKEAGRDGSGSKLFVQCFEVEPLRRLHKLLPDVKLVQLVSAQGGPVDIPTTTYAAMLQPAGLREIATYAAVLGADMKILADAPGGPAAPVSAARAAGLAVHVWTLRKENLFLPDALRRGQAPNATGDVGAAVAQLRAAGVEGIITDDPALVTPSAR